MPRSDACSPNSDTEDDVSAMEELFVAQRARGVHRSRRHNDLSRAELRDENLWLEQQLAISESHVNHLQERVRQLKTHVKAVEKQRSMEHEQRRRAMETKEKKWTEQYDRHMQALLRIIAHHEEMHQTLKKEIETMKMKHKVENDKSNAVATKTTIVGEAATQTEGGNASGPAETGMKCDGCCIQKPAEVLQDESVQRRGPPQTDSSISHIDDVDVVDPIHEQYAALTMQKLLEQLRQSDTERSPSRTHSELASSSFRDSIHNRLTKSQSNSSSSTSLLHLRRLKLAPISESFAESDDMITASNQKFDPQSARAPEAA